MLLKEKKLTTKIMLKDLNYWNVDLQEAYFSPREVNERFKNLKKDPLNGNHIERAPVKIGNNVQIGTNSVILPGVTIGDNVIIGALTLVNKDIPSNCKAVGSPVKILYNDSK